jgi:hypothetical protein
MVCHATTAPLSLTPKAGGKQHPCKQIKLGLNYAMAKTPKRPSLVTRGFLGASVPLALIPLIREAAYGSRMSVSAWVTRAVQEKLDNERKDGR